MKIKPDADALWASHRTGSLHDISPEEISRVLGFKPNADDDPDKVKFSWAGWAGRGKTKPIVIWDYEGSYQYGDFSTYGDAKILLELFGRKFTPGP